MISPFDRGFLWGDCAYEITPCFNREIFRLRDYLNRFYHSLRYVRIDFKTSREDLEKLTLDMPDRNFPYMAEEGAYRVGHWMTRGMDTPSMAPRSAGPPTLFIFFRPVAVEAIARYYVKGLKLSIVPIRRVPPQCLETRAKVTSKLNQILAELNADTMSTAPRVLDIYGYVAENSTANFFYGERRGYPDPSGSKYFGRNHPESRIGVSLAPGDPPARKAFHLL